MKRKWWIAGGLLLVELGLCGAIVGVSCGSINAVGRAGAFYRLFRVEAVPAVARRGTAGCRCRAGRAGCK